MLIMALLRSGHSRVYEYGYSMFQLASEELAEHSQNEVVNLAYAHRISKSTDENWMKFIKDSEKTTKKTKQPKEKKVMTKEDHMAVIRRLKGL